MKKSNDKQNYRYTLLSPLDSRYYFSNTPLFESLSQYLSEDASVHFNIQVELALLLHLVKSHSVSSALLNKTKHIISTITAQEVYHEEEKTKHHMRALVNVIKQKVPVDIRKYIHLGATSHDIIETSTALRIKAVSYHVLIPLLARITTTLIQLADTHIDVAQVGRTHGQFAVPITVGHFFAEYISRLGQSIESLLLLVKKVPGKLSGAVGTYNALSLIVDNPLQFEKDVLASLGLMPSEHSTQICSPEPLLRLLLEYNIVFGILANLADDLRNLQRSEIAEMQEFFSDTQVGSSTMPQKKNPWNSEHIKSLYKAFSPRVMTFFMDQISEHQRDLSNSASSRFISEYLSGFAAAANRSLSVLQSLHINKDQMQYNLKQAGDSIYAEAIYILLSLDGYNDAHEITRQISTTYTHSSLSETLKSSYPTLWESIATQLKKHAFHDPDAFFNTPKQYTGYSVQRTKKIISKYKKYMTKVQELCSQYQDKASKEKDTSV